MRQAGLGGRGWQIIDAIDPVAFPEPGRPAQIDRDQVHRDPAEHRQLGSVMQENPAIGKAAQIAVGIAHRQNAHGMRLFGNILRIIAELVAPIEHADLDDFRLRNRNLPDRPLQLRTLDSAIKRQAGPGNVEMIVLAQGNAGAIGKAGPAGRQDVQCRPVAVELVGRGKMAHPDIDGQSRHKVRAQVFHVDAKPVHAAVDHDIAGPSGRLPPVQLFQAVEHRLCR